MTMPHERTRALIYAGELLEDLRMRDDLPSDIKKRVIQCLRHYPGVGMIRQIGYMVPRRRSGTVTDNPLGLHEDFDTDLAMKKKLRDEIPNELRKMIAKVPGVELTFMFGEFAAGDLEADKLEIVVIGNWEDASILEFIRAATFMNPDRDVVVLAYTPEQWQNMMVYGNRFAIRCERGPKIWLVGGKDE